MPPDPVLILTYMVQVVKPTFDLVATFFLALGMTIYLIESISVLIKRK